MALNRLGAADRRVPSRRSTGTGVAVECDPQHRALDYRIHREGALTPSAVIDLSMRTGQCLADGTSVTIASRPSSSVTTSVRVKGAVLKTRVPENRTAKASVRA